MYFYACNMLEYYHIIPGSVTSLWPGLSVRVGRPVGSLVNQNFPNGHAGSFTTHAPIEALVLYIVLI